MNGYRIYIQPDQINKKNYCFAKRNFADYDLNLAKLSALGVKEWYRKFLFREHWYKNSAKERYNGLFQYTGIA